ncbi:MAG: Ig-like domain-containing protein [Chitinophagaceae bacterium]
MAGAVIDGAAYKNDFIELYNNSSAAVSLTGWSVQYASSTGTTWQVTILSGSIPANGHYLIQEAAGAGGTANLPTPDATGSIAMSGTAGKVILCNVTTAQTGANPVGTQIIDKVGYGAGTNGFEGAGPTATLTNTTSAQRNPEGFDSNNNSTDFTTGAPSPANASRGTDITPPSISTLLPSNNATNVSTSFPASITFSETIQKGAAGTISIKKLSDNSVIQIINTTNATVIVSGSSVSFDVNSLAFNTTYYVEISNGAFKDLSNNNFAGITGNTTWRFTTSATPPVGILEQPTALVHVVPDCLMAFPSIMF